ncbi:tRNA modification GTPase [Lachnospiraceae bacterium XPB1003]|nr:tRNA modification GTPase [Lachnospiraceae bacterium XPB1003]
MTESFNSSDTIAAIATGMTQAGIGIIRISGPDVFEVADKIFRTGSGKKISDMKSNTINHGYIFENNRKTDEVLASVMRAPHSYTGEDTVEINCHGGLYLLNRVLQIIIENGARLAEPGEFTKRAFLNGRMDLSEAEAVMDLISSHNKYAADNSMKQLSGNLKEKIVNIRKQIIYESAYIESALDDPEHFDLTGYPEKLKIKINDFLNIISSMIDSYENGRIMKEGIKTAILGKPNAGKSSLLNFLSGHESAIVTDIAGTTRDAIEESVRIGSLQLNLIDTAGIRNTEDIVEKIGVEKALEISEEADLVLYVIDSSVPLDENDQRIISIIKDKNTIILFNKTDLDQAVSEEDINIFINNNHNIPILRISLKDGNGIDELEKILDSKFVSEGNQLNDEVIVTNLRHFQELKSAKESLLNVEKSIDDGMEEDFFTVDLMDAYRHLGMIIGEETGEDLVNEIFSKFCMGK